MRHSVTSTVKPMYSTSAVPVIQAKLASKRTARMVSTIAISTSVGTMEYSENDTSDSMPRTPRSMSRVMPPVCRSR